MSNTNDESETTQTSFGLISRICSSSGRKALWRGQIISLLIAGTGVFASLLSNTTPSSNIPSLMSFLNYALLSTYLFRNRCHVCYRKNDTYDMEQFNTPASKKFIIFTKYKYGWYFLAALLDVQANFFVINAYNYTSVTSIMLLDCFTIPCVMTLSVLFLSYTYTKKHILGVIICTSGLGLIVLSDAYQNNDNSIRFPYALTGDFLCLLSSVFYACSNVLQETLLKFNSREVFLGHLGVFAAILAFIQCMALDISSIKATNFTIEVCLYISGFVFCLFFMYTNTTLFLQKNDSTLFNLSLLTSDVYAVIFAYFLYGHLVHWLYFLAFFTVFVGLTLYHIEVEPKTTSALVNFENIITAHDRQFDSIPDYEMSESDVNTAATATDAYSDVERKTVSTTIFSPMNGLPNSNNSSSNNNNYNNNSNYKHTTNQ